MIYLMALAKTEPEKAAEQVVKAIRAARCHIGRAALVLGISRASMTRIIASLGIRSEILLLEERAKVEGWHHDSLGGAQHHANPSKRAKKAWSTRRKNARSQ